MFALVPRAFETRGDEGGGGEDRKGGDDLEGNPWFVCLLVGNSWRQIRNPTEESLPSRFELMNGEDLFLGRFETKAPDGILGAYNQAIGNGIHFSTDT